MKIRAFVALCLTFLLSIGFVSCKTDVETGWNNGILANEDVVSSIRQELQDKENSLLANPDDVFWTASGTLWHSTYNCSYLSRSKTIYHGSLEDAKLQGKTGACERCGAGGNSIEDIYAQIENNSVAAGDVFFTKDGILWHTSDQCEKLLNADKIYHSNRALALALGKSAACEKCGTER